MPHWQQQIIFIRYCIYVSASSPESLHSRYGAWPCPAIQCTAGLRYPNGERDNGACASTNATVAIICHCTCFVILPIIGLAVPGFHNDGRIRPALTAPDGELRVLLPGVYLVLRFAASAAEGHSKIDIRAPLLHLLEPHLHDILRFRASLARSYPKRTCDTSGCKGGESDQFYSCEPTSWRRAISSRDVESVKRDRAKASKTCPTAGRRTVHIPS